MTAGAMFELVLRRAVVIEGRRWVSGARLQADARTAVEMIEDGLARLAQDSELPRLIELVGARRLEGATR